MKDKEVILEQSRSADHVDPGSNGGAAGSGLDNVELERELAKRDSEIAKLKADLEAFTYMASHDLHEPLRKLSTFGQLLMQNARNELSGKSMDYLHRMMNATNTMRDLVNNLQSFSEVGRDPGIFTVVDLGKIIEEVLAEQDNRVTELGALVNVGQMPIIECSPSQIRQLFSHLLDNALKFVKPVGVPVINIDCRPVKDGELSKYNLSGHRSYSYITVSDTGIGFDNTYAERIFQIFHRLHGKSEYSGSGIGLSICRKIAEYHHGVIFGNGEPGKGSTFTLILPVKG